MSGLRSNRLPAVALAALFVAACSGVSASAQSDPAAGLRPAPDAVEKWAEAAPDSARLTAAERDFFNPRSRTAPSEWEARAVAESLSSPRTPDDDQGGAADDAGQQQPAAANPLRAPLTPGQKMRRAFKGAFLSPAGYARTALSAAITEATEEDLPHKETDDRIADGLSRFAIRFSSRATRTLLGSGVYPILFKQDPRYDRSTSKSIPRRALHAVSRVFVTRGDNGSLQPNYSRFAGSFSASALSNIWEQSTPGRDRIGWDATVRRFAGSFPDDMLNNLIFREFLPDIIRIFRRK